MDSYLPKGFYEVDDALQKRYKGKTPFYLLKWTNYSE